MARYVIDLEAALRLAKEGGSWSPDHTLLAPTLLRSQVLDALFRRVRSGEMTEAEGLALNAEFGRLKIRYLGDAVLRRRAWAVAEQAGMSSTFDAECIALTLLQGDALVTEDASLSKNASEFVQVKPYAAILS